MCWAINKLKIYQYFSLYPKPDLILTIFPPSLPFPGYVYFLLSFSLIGIVVLGLFGAYRCLRVATVLGRGTGTQTSEALATLPIQFITSDDLAAAVAAAAAGASINADSNHLPVPVSHFGADLLI